MKMVGNKIKLSKFEREVNKIMCATPEYVQLIEQMEKVQAKQVALDKKYVEIAAQIQAARDEYRPLYDKRCRMQRELGEKISAELMKDPKMAKLVDVYDK